MASGAPPYVIQPYSHLAPIKRFFRRQGLRIIEVVPSKTDSVINKLEHRYCGLTPLPYIVYYKLPVHQGPSVYTPESSPSVVIHGEVEDICDCDAILVSRESIASYAYAVISVNMLCPRPPIVTHVYLEEGNTVNARICKLYIGDKGIQVYANKNSNLIELAKIYKKATGLSPVFAASAGMGCKEITGVLRRATKLRYTLGDVLAAYRRLRVPLNAVIKYFSSIRLDYNPRLIKRNIEVLQEFKHLIIPQPMAR